MGKVLGIVGLKGGGGKTTLTAHLADAAMEDGYKVLIIDTDIQNSLSDWHASGNSGLELENAAGEQQLDFILEDADHDYILIDGPPSVGSMTEAIIKRCDKVITPCQPSPLDLWALQFLRDMTNVLAKEAGIVISRAIGNSRMPDELRKVAEDMDYGKVFKTAIKNRVIYPKVMAEGTTTLVVAPNSPATEEIQNLWQEVKTWL